MELMYERITVSIVIYTMHFSGEQLPTPAHSSPSPLRSLLSFINLNTAH